MCSIVFGRFSIVFDCFRTVFGRFSIPFDSFLMVFDGFLVVFDGLGWELSKFYSYREMLYVRDIPLKGKIGSRQRTRADA